MITKTDLEAIKLSPTKKDYYQIWNELLDTAKKLSERWDPTATNESDPGIVLLKVLTAVADKLNYNIDKNILEAFMPSAAQEESMRKLCEMMGYNIKYYQSATTKVTFAHVGKDTLPATGLIVPLFTNITNIDQDINFVTIESKTLTNDAPSQEILCMEGQLVQCETNEDNVISMNQIDDKLRYYLPEVQVAENGIFVYNIDQESLSTRWDKIDNLNVIKPGACVYKFGFDSKLGRPYIQFPEDLVHIIKDGLVIYYLRTSGLNGNVSSNTLTTFELPVTDEWENLSTDAFSVRNYNAATNGQNVETLTQAYNNFKKTVGTFDTLVTCRDYMNKIYQLLESDATNTPLVSNIIVSDIRDDINRAITLCSFNNYGIVYKSQSLENSSHNKLIQNFDLVLYPFKTIYNLDNKDEYIGSFKYDPTVYNEIENRIEEYKTISHKFCIPEDTEIVCVKNYLKINATITTTYKVNIPEENIIINNIKKAIFKTFNAHQLDFGEEIPKELIDECIQNADTRIKNIAVNEPILYTKVVLANGNEYDIATETGGVLTNNDAKFYYNKLVLRNILAGRVQLFDYNLDFIPSFSESSYPSDTTVQYNPVYTNVNSITPECEIMINKNYSSILKLNANEVVRLRAPNFKTDKIYPAYINYYLHLNTPSDLIDGDSAAIPAIFQTLREFMLSNGSGGNKVFVNMFNRYNSPASALMSTETLTTQERYQRLLSTYGGVCTFDSTAANGSKFKEFSWTATPYSESLTYDKGSYVTDNDDIIWVCNTNGTTGAWDSTKWNAVEVYGFKINNTSYQSINSLVIQTQPNITGDTTNTEKGLYVAIGRREDYVPGPFVDETYTKYRKSVIYPTNITIGTELDNLFVETRSGKEASFLGIKANEEYYLKDGEYLILNWIESDSSDTTSTTTSREKNKKYTIADGKVIKPNFDLYDSKRYNTKGNPYLKTDQALLNRIKAQCSVSELDGLYTLGTNEQIEVRALAQTELKEEISKLYWVLNDKEETSMNIKNGQGGEYTLKEGEYLYYTNAAEADLAYWGSGTTIKLIVPNGVTDFAIYNPSTADTTVTAEDIETNGVRVIPWTVYNLSDTTYILITECQYINLVEGNSFEFDVSDEDNLTGNDHSQFIINNTWRRIKNSDKFKYYIDNDDFSLPKINIAISHNGVATQYGWEIRSYLVLNTNSNKPQLLIHTPDSSAASTAYYIADKAILTFTDPDTSALTVTPQYTNSSPVYIPLNIKTNWPVQTTNTLKFSSESTDSNAYLKVNITGQSRAGLYTDGVCYPITFNNYNSAWTTCTFKTVNNTIADYLKLSVTLPDETKTFGLLMIYLVNGSSTATNNIRIETLDDSVSIFNNNGNWWSDGKVSPENVGDNYQYFLHKGLNIIQFKRNSDLYLKYPGSATSTDPQSIIFGTLDIVNYTAKNSFGFNNSMIQYQAIDQSTPYAQLAADINKADPDHNFYYNCIMDNRTMLDLNTLLLTTKDKETLMTARTWYDYNNLNNKFVISEIDADYLDTGIRITKASKL